METLLVGLFEICSRGYLIATMRTRIIRAKHKHGQLSILIFAYAVYNAQLDEATHLPQREQGTASQRIDFEVVK